MYSKIQELLIEHIKNDFMYDDNTVGDIYVDKIYHKMSNTTRPFVEENPGLGKLPCKRKYNFKKYVTKK